MNIAPLGGVGMALSFFISVRLLGEAESSIVSISVFALAISILGFVDDFLNLNWKMKIFFQLIFVGFPIIFLNQTINFEILFGLNFSGQLNSTVTILWLLVLMNAINFIDNMDGFAAVNSIFICLALSILSFVFRQNYLADVSFILLFTILGFLIFNSRLQDYIWVIQEVCLLDLYLVLLVFYLTGILRVKVIFTAPLHQFFYFLLFLY